MAMPKGPGYLLQVLARASLWAFRVYPYREYKLKEPCVREDIGSGILSGDYEKKKRYICIQSCLSSLNT